MKLTFTCNEMVAPEVAPISQPNNKPPRAGKMKLYLTQYYFCMEKRKPYNLEGKTMTLVYFIGQKSQHCCLIIFFRSHPFLLTSMAEQFTEMQDSKRIQMEKIIYRENKDGKISLWLKITYMSICMQDYCHMEKNTNQLLIKITSIF